MTQRLEAQGSKKDEGKWDDGFDNDDVSKIYVQFDHEGIRYIRFDYIKNGQPKYGSFHGVAYLNFTQTFEINHLKDEQLESVEGYYDPKTSVILGLQFKTNLRISKLMGYQKEGTKFSLAVDGKKIIGFHGTAWSNAVNSIGAYFNCITPARLEAKGGKGSMEWNDGADHEGVTKIYVRGDCECVQFIKCDYVKDGQQIYGSQHGVSDRAGYTQTFEINHLNKEYLESVEAYYEENDKFGIIHGLEFKTNNKTSGLIGYAKGKKFILAANKKKIVGFHGYVEKHLTSLGAYFTTIPLTKTESKGDTIAGDLWDDGTFKAVRKVYVCYNAPHVRCVRFDYDNSGQVERLEHGVLLGKEEEFVVNYPNEFITSVEGTLLKAPTYTYISSLAFKTSTGRTSSTFGKASDDKFVLESKGCAVVGFHGRSNRHMAALGAYFRPLPPLPDSEKLEAQGGDGGASWDDGGFDGIRCIYIGHSETGISFNKFLYEMDNHAVIGDDHGSKKLPGVDEFVLDSPCEYLISVEGRYDVLEGGESEVIRMLKFKTNLRTSQVFGLDTDSNFTLEKECHKIVGFHGKSSNMLNQIGVHVLPIAE